MARFVLSDGRLNRYGFRVLTAGIDISDFLKNPVMLYMHDRSIMPIGTWKDVKKEGDQLTAEAVFDEKDPFAQQVQSKVDQGILSACSAGLELIEWSEDPKQLVPGQTRPTATKTSLREASIVDIPGNANALKLNLGAGLWLSDDAAASATTLDKFLPTLHPPRTMQLVLSALNLGANATEAEAVAAIGRIKADANKETADTIIKLAEQAGLVTPENKERFAKLAATAPELCLSFLDFSSLKPAAGGSQAAPAAGAAPRQTLADAITLAAQGKGAPAAGEAKTGILKLAEQRKDWTHRDWEKKDPNGLLKLKAEHSDVYQELYTAFYGTRL